jgi:hypothetical protein
MLTVGIEPTVSILLLTKTVHVLDRAAVWSATVTMAVFVISTQKPLDSASQKKTVLYVHFVEALCSKPECPGFHFPLGHWILELS